MKFKGPKFHAIIANNIRKQGKKKVHTSFDAKYLISWNVVIATLLGCEDTNQNPSNGIKPKIAKRENSKEN